jgi:hypothetical protein
MPSKKSKHLKSKMKNIAKTSTFLILMLLAFQSISFAQSIPNSVMKSGAFEAEFHFDVFYSIVLCNGERTLLITTFNESGTKTQVGFDIEFADADGTKQTVQVPIFSSKLAEMLRSSCGSDTNSFLRFKLDESIDLKTLQGKIKFYSK